MKKFLFVVIALGLVGGGYALVTKRTIEPPVTSEVLFGIQGRWMSLDDEKAVMVFDTEGTFENVYDGVSVSTGTWELNQDTLVKKGNGDSLTYAVLELTEQNLVLSYTARGNTLRYVRVVELK